MTLVRWNPLREIERWEPFPEMGIIRQQMDRLFEQLLPPDGGEKIGLTFIPAAEIAETDNDLTLRVEIPGLDASDLDVEVTPESVSISGERKSETTTEVEGMTRSEFRYGKFQRLIALPAVVDNERVRAEYKNGILHLTIPKAESEKHKAVKVRVG
jgi:HSP20 family protein